MRPYLILRLSGPMQAWGQQTFEGTRPTASFPTRSGLLGLLGACLGIRREDRVALTDLSDSVRFAVRCDTHLVNKRPVAARKLTDYHTIQDAREDYQGMKSHDTIQTWREYLCDAHFTVALWCVPNSAHEVNTLVAAVQKPRFTPYLGRRSCPLNHPLYLGHCEALNPLKALNAFGAGGEVYSEEPIGPGDRRFRARDDPIMALPRQFAARDWFVIQGESACS